MEKKIEKKLKNIVVPIVKYSKHFAIFDKNG